MSIRRTLLGAATALCASAVVAAPARGHTQRLFRVGNPVDDPGRGDRRQAWAEHHDRRPILLIERGHPARPDDRARAGPAREPDGCPSVLDGELQRRHCPASSQIGSGYITGIAPEFGLALSLPTYAYLIRPTGSEIARMGVVVYFFGFPVVTESAPISIRTTPDVGINIPLTSLPNQLDGIDAILTHLNLRIDGMVDGKTFTRNPTSCSPATTTVTVDSYESPTTSTTGQSSFTPTGCGTLPYAPKLSGVASHDTGDDGAGFAATITQSSGQADNTNVLLTLPASLSPRLSLLASACTNRNLSLCPTIGTAAIATPLLNAPLAARIVLVAHAGGIPTLAILIPAPIDLQLNATPIITGPAVGALLVGIPDIPLSSLTLSLPGGPNSLFRAGVHLCSTPQAVSGHFAGWNGATANPSATVVVSGCAGGSSNTSASATRMTTTVPAASKRVSGSPTRDPRPQPPAMGWSATPRR